MVETFTYCGLAMLYGSMYIWVSIGLGSGLLPDGTKPLPEPMLTGWPRSMLPYDHMTSLGHSELMPNGTKPLPEPMYMFYQMGFCGIHLRTSEQFQKCSCI